jgi:hypothetical protein
VRVAKIDRDACLDRELKVPAHLDALVPGDRASELSRQALHGLAHGLFDVDARFPIGQVQEQRQARGPLDQRADCAATSGTEDVGSDRSAQSAFELVGFSGPPAEPDVRLSPHPALHRFMPLVRVILPS